MRVRGEREREGEHECERANLPGRSGGGGEGALFFSNALRL
jgi:hypothetical protein